MADVMPFEYACTIMGRPPLRTIAFGNNNNVTDASMQLGMKSILLAGNTPRYELKGADTIVGSLSDLRITNLKVGPG